MADDATPEDITLYGHIGSDPAYTIDSLPGYAWGLDHGLDFTGDENVWMTKDGVLVMRHDDLPQGFANTTYAQAMALDPAIETFDSILELVIQKSIETGRDLGIYAELKDPSPAAAEALIQTLVAHDFVDPSRVIIANFNANSLIALHDDIMPRYGVDLPLAYLVSGLPNLDLAWVKSFADALMPGIAPNALPAETVAALHAAGLKVIPWTFTGSQTDIQALVGSGHDGIILADAAEARTAINALNGIATEFGTTGADRLSGTAGADETFAMAGSDLVHAGAGDDVVWGDAGNDVLFGEAGDDTLTGGSGTDFLSGGEGADTLDGSTGNDVIVASGDTILFRAGSGIDLVSLDSASTISFRDIASGEVTIIQDGTNLIIRAGDDALVMRDGGDAAHQPASIVFADGVTWTGADLMAHATPGTDAAVDAALPDLDYVLAKAPALATASTIPVGTELVADGAFDGSHLAQQIADAETGVIYRLSFSLADLPSGEDGVRVLWGGQVIYEGVPAGTGSKLHFIVSGGSGDGSNELVFQGAGEDPAAFGATLDDVHLVKIADVPLPAPGNVAPVAPDTAFLISRDVHFDGKAIATDANGDVLAYSLGEGPAHGALVLKADGSYTYTPDTGYAGADSFTVLVNDGFGGVVESAVNLTVAPEILLGTDLIVNGSFEDVGQSSDSSGPSDWGYRNLDGQIVGWTNTANKRIEQHWDHYGGVTAKDGQFWIDMDSSGLAARHRIGQTIEHVEAGASYRVTFSLSDSDTERLDDGVQVLWNGEVIFAGLPPQSSIMQTSAGWTTYGFDVVGGSGNGSNRLEFIDTGVADSWGAGAALDDIHFVKIADAGDALPDNQAPAAADATAEGKQGSVITGALTAADPDADASLIFSLGDGPSHGTALIYTDGTYRYTPAAGFSGADSFTFLVDDGHGGRAEARVSLTIDPVDTSIEIGTDLIINGSFEDVSESSGSNGPADWGYRNTDGQILGWTNTANKRIEQHWDHYGGVTAKDGQFWIDMDSSGLAARHRIGQTIAHAEDGATYRVTFSLSDSDTVRNDDGVKVLWNGEVIFAGLPPQTSASWATLSFDVVGGSGDGSNRLEFVDTGVSDSWGAGVALDDVHFVKIANAGDPLPENQAPAAGNASAEGQRNTAITGQLTATDPDGDASLIFSLGAGPSHGTALVYTDGTYRYTPAAGFTGADSFTFLVQDGHGGSTEATVSLRVNNAPVVVPADPVTTEEDRAVSGTIAATDGDGDALAFAVKDGAGPAHGAVQLDAATGAWTYTPDANANGDDSFTVVVSDGHGGSTEAVVRLTVDPVNDLPVTVADTGAVGAHGTASFDLVANDTDAEDGQPHLTGFTVMGVDGIAVGTDTAASAFQIVDGKLAFTAGTIFQPLDQGQHATVTLGYTAADNDGGEVTGQFVLTIEGDLHLVAGTAKPGLLLGTSGADHILGGGSNDTIFSDAGNDFIEAGSGNDTILATAGDKTIHGGAGNDVIMGGSGSEIITGDAGNDTLSGGAGADVISGGAGNDNIVAGFGDDIIAGGAGNDQIFGNLGSDTFIFGAGGGHDMVGDFQASGAGHDLIQLDSAAFADFDALMGSGHVRNVLGGVEISYDDGSALTLYGIATASLHADDFIFA